jgi:hypothetical protein
MNEIQNYSFICQHDKFISIKNRNDESKQDNIFFVFYYRCDSHATKDLTRFHWIIDDHVIHELYCHILYPKCNIFYRVIFCFLVLIGQYLSRNWLLNT